MQIELSDPVVSSLIFGASNGLLAILLSPIQFLKIIRQETNAGYLSIAHEYYRVHGIKVFFRGYKPYAAMQFLSSAVFGVSTYISDLILAHCYNSIVLEVAMRSVLGAIFETAVTIQAEMSEITRNKKEFMKSPAQITEILLVIFSRNTIFWMGSIIAYKISVLYTLSYADNILIGLIAGIITGAISIPLDAIGTRNCGSNISMSIMARLRSAYTRGGLNMIFSGTVMRVVQISLYTALTALIMLILHHH